ncbi:MAG: hypothetical protein LBR47_03560 [Spirochaetaceae bacterium]|jgi:hypothetical protein|nr:hypothetical protein [Spirochaetaceae bacterium]
MKKRIYAVIFVLFTGTAAFSVDIAVSGSILNNSDRTSAELFVGFYQHFGDYFMMSADYSYNPVNHYSLRSSFGFENRFFLAGAGLFFGFHNGIAQPGFCFDAGARIPGILSFKGGCGLLLNPSRMSNLTSFTGNALLSLFVDNVIVSFVFLYKMQESLVDSEVSRCGQLDGSFEYEVFSRELPIGFVVSMGIRHFKYRFDDSADAEKMRVMAGLTMRWGKRDGLNGFVGMQLFPLTLYESDNGGRIPDVNFAINAGFRCSFN